MNNSNELIKPCYGSWESIGTINIQSEMLNALTLHLKLVSSTGIYNDGIQAYSYFDFPQPQLLKKSIIIILLMQLL